jgi:hypothetical protein
LFAVAVIPGAFNANQDVSIRISTFDGARRRMKLTGEKTAAFGIYEAATLAKHGVNRLISGGFLGDAISILLPNRNSSKAFAHEKSTKAPERTAAGVTSGGCHRRGLEFDRRGRTGKLPRWVAGQG